MDAEESMTRRSQWTGRKTALVGAAAAAALAMMGGGIALADTGILGPDGTISSCYENSKIATPFGSTDNPLAGQLRVVPAGTKCRTGESALTWNQQGPSGVASVNVQTNTVQVAPHLATLDNVRCPAGDIATGGGAQLAGGVGLYTSTLTTNAPFFPTSSATPTGWTATAYNGQDYSVNLQAWAICVKGM